LPKLPPGATSYPFDIKIAPNIKFYRTAQYCAPFAASALCAPIYNAPQAMLHAKNNYRQKALSTLKTDLAESRSGSV